MRSAAPGARLMAEAYRRGLRVLPARAAVTIQYAKAHRRLPDLRTPRTFSEKIQYRKLHDRDPRLPLLADKVLVKAHVAQRLGSSWVIPTIWSGPDLPPVAERTWEPPFVVKTNHGSGRNVFVTVLPDWPTIERWCRRWLHQRWQPHEHQWVYSEIRPQLMIEPYVGPLGRALVDYKYFVFGGRVEFIQVDTGRRHDHRRNFFDRDWRPQPVQLGDKPGGALVERPRHLREMLQAAETLAEEIDFVRVDFYQPDRPLFGEMTFYPGSGYERFSPRRWDRMFGDLWP